MSVLDFFRNKKNQKEQKNAAVNQEVGEHLLDEAKTTASIKAFKAKQAEEETKVTDGELEKEVGEIEEEAFSEPAGDVEVKNLEKLRREAEAQAKAIQEDQEKAALFREVSVYLEVLDGELKDAAALPLSVRGIDKEIQYIADRMVEDLKRERMESVKACLEALEDGVMHCRTHIPSSEMGDKRAILKKRISILREHRKYVELCEDIDNLERNLRKSELEFSEYDTEYRDCKDKLSAYSTIAVAGVRALLKGNEPLPADDVEAHEIKDLINRQANAFANRKLSEKSVQADSKTLEERRSMQPIVRDMINKLHLNLHIELSRKLANTLSVWKKWAVEDAKERKKWNELRKEILALINAPELDDGSGEVYVMLDDMIQKAQREQQAYQDRMKRLEAIEQAKAQAQGQTQGQTQSQDQRVLQTNQ